MRCKGCNDLLTDWEIGRKAGGTPITWEAAKGHTRSLRLTNQTYLDLCGKCADWSWAVLLENDKGEMMYHGKTVDDLVVDDTKTQGKKDYEVDNGWN